MHQPWQNTPTQHRESLCPGVAKFHRPGQHHKFIVQSLELGPPTRSDRNASTFGKPHQPDTGNPPAQVRPTYDPGDITKYLCRVLKVKPPNRGWPKCTKPWQTTPTRHKEPLCPGVTNLHDPGGITNKLCRILKVRPPNRGWPKCTKPWPHNPTQGFSLSRCGKISSTRAASQIVYRVFKV